MLPELFKLRLESLTTLLAQEEFAKRQTFAFVTYIATALGDMTTRNDTQQTRSVCSLSRILQAYGVGYDVTP